MPVLALAVGDLQERHAGEEGSVRGDVHAVRHVLGVPGPGSERE